MSIVSLYNDDTHNDSTINTNDNNVNNDNNKVAFEHRRHGLQHVL